MTDQPPSTNTASVDAALSVWRQGDCVVGEQWFVYRQKKENPPTDGDRTAAADETDLVEAAVRGFVLISQTCDVVRSCADRPYVEVAPLVEVDAGQLIAIKRGRIPRYAFVPGIEDHHLVGDLDRVMTVEKAVVAGWERTQGCRDDEEVRAIRMSLARKRVRIAFPDDFVEFATRLQDRLKAKHGKQSDEGAGLRALREIRVRAAPSWHAPEVSIHFWFVREREQLKFNDTSWYSLLQSWLQLVPPAGRFKVVDGLVVTLDDITAADFIESDPLDLDHLSSPAS